MRGNPFVELIAILFMLLSVLVAGKVWIDWKVSKGETMRNEVVLPQQSNNSFEHLHKRTE